MMVHGVDEDAVIETGFMEPHRQACGTSCYA